MEKYIRIKRLEYIRAVLYSDMRKMSGQLKADAQADIAALDYAIKLVKEQE